VEDNFLIPANSKKSILILGFFTPLDLFIFLLGVAFSIIMLITIQTSAIVVMLLIITPALISAFLILPVPYYHNILQLITNIYEFYSNRRRLYWKGWCASGESKE
jgi:hypothetical protein